MMRFASWPGWLKGAAALGVGFICGAGVITVRFLLVGSADPFADGWPLLLNVLAASAAFVIVAILGHGPLASFGVYLGLVTHVFAASAPYPVAACVALALHGWVPALAGAFAASALFRASWSLWRRDEPDREERSE